MLPLFLLQILRARVVRADGRARRQTRFRGVRESAGAARERLSRSTPKTLTRTEPRGEIPVHAGVLLSRFAEEPTAMECGPGFN